jgi:hypothetical protein
VVRLDLISRHLDEVRRLEEGDRLAVRHGESCSIMCITQVQRSSCERHYFEQLTRVTRQLRDACTDHVIERQGGTRSADDGVTTRDELAKEVWATVAFTKGDFDPRSVLPTGCEHCRECFRVAWRHRAHRHVHNVKMPRFEQLPTQCAEKGAVPLHPFPPRSDQEEWRCLRWTHELAQQRGAIEVTPLQVVDVDDDTRP